MAAFGGLAIKSTPLLVNGVLYFSAPDHVWAVDARTGRERWHYFWRTRGGIHIGNRGVGMYGKWLYFLTPDNYFVSLDAATGKERWHKEIASIKREYFSTAAPIIIRNHVILGVGGDSLDVPGLSRVARSGDGRGAVALVHDAARGRARVRDLARRVLGGPRRRACPGSPGSYDPELNLYYFGTGNANPVLAGQSRQGDNLWTCSIVAINPDTGKMAWYYQATPPRHPRLGRRPGADPHRRRDRRKAAQADRAGQPQRPLLPARSHERQARAHDPHGRHASTGRRASTPTASPSPIPARMRAFAGSMVLPTTDGVTNWPPPSFSPDTGLFYVGIHEAMSVFYLTDTDPRPQGWGAAERRVGEPRELLKAIDYKTGKVRWSRSLAMNAGGPAGGPMGLLSTAGGLLFGNDGAGNFVAYDAATGKPLWHAGLGSEHQQRAADLRARRPAVRRGGRGRFPLRVHPGTVTEVPCTPAENSAR